MKTCHEIQLRLDDLRSGRLDADLRRTMLAHLETCAVCRAFYELDQNLRDELADLPVLACPGRVSERILAQVAAEGQPIATKSTATKSTETKPQRQRAVERRTVGARLRARTWLPTAALLAAAAVLLVVLLPERNRQPAPGPGTDVVYQQADITAARGDALRGLVRAARIIEKSERTTLNDVLGRQLPGTITGSLREALEDRRGGRG